MTYTHSGIIASSDFFFAILPIFVVRQIQSSFEDVAQQLLGLALADEPKDESFGNVVNGFRRTVSVIFAQNSSISLSCILTLFSAGITTIARIPYIKAIASKTNFLRKITLIYTI